MRRGTRRGPRSPSSESPQNASCPRIPQLRELLLLSSGQLVTPILLPQQPALALVFLRTLTISFPVSSGRAAPSGVTAPTAWRCCPGPRPPSSPFFPPTGKSAPLEVVHRLPGHSTETTSSRERRATPGGLTVRPSPSPTLELSPCLVPLTLGRLPSVTSTKDGQHGRHRPVEAR